MINSGCQPADAPQIANLGFVAGEAVIWATPSDHDPDVWNNRRCMSPSCGLPAYDASPPLYTSIMLELAAATHEQSGLFSAKDI